MESQVSPSERMCERCENTPGEVQCLDCVTKTEDRFDMRVFCRSCNELIHISGFASHRVTPLVTKVRQDLREKANNIRKSFNAASGKVQEFSLIKEQLEESMRLHERTIRQAIVAQQQQLKEKGTALVKQLKAHYQGQIKQITDVQNSFQANLKAFEKFTCDVQSLCEKSEVEFASLVMADPNLLNQEWNEMEEISGDNFPDHKIVLKLDDSRITAEIEALEINLSTEEIILSPANLTAPEVHEDDENIMLVTSPISKNGIFWALHDYDGVTEKLNQINSYVRREYITNKHWMTVSQSSQVLCANDRVYAKYHNNKWYRGVVENVTDNEPHVYSVRFVDYGNVDKVPTDKLLPVREEEGPWNHQAVRCCLFPEEQPALLGVARWTFNDLALSCPLKTSFISKITSQGSDAWFVNMTCEDGSALRDLVESKIVKVTDEPKIQCHDIRYTASDEPEDAETTQPPSSPDVNVTEQSDLLPGRSTSPSSLQGNHAEPDRTPVEQAPQSPPPVTRHPAAVMVTEENAVWEALSRQNTESKKGQQPGAVINEDSINVSAVCVGENHFEAKPSFKVIEQEAATGEPMVNGALEDAHVLAPNSQDNNGFCERSAPENCGKSSANVVDCGTSLLSQMMSAAQPSSITSSPRSAVRDPASLSNSPMSSSRDITSALSVPRGVHRDPAAGSSSPKPTLADLTQSPRGRGRPIRGSPNGVTMTTEHETKIKFVENRTTPDRTIAAESLLPMPKLFRDSQMKVRIAGDLNEYGNFVAVIQPEGSERAKIERFNDNFRKYCNLACQPGEVVNGHIYAVKRLKDDRWFRGVARSEPRKRKVEVWLADEGIDMTVAEDSVRELSDKLACAPHQSFKCTIGNVQYQKFGPEACEVFKQLTNNKILDLTVKKENTDQIQVGLRDATGTPVECEVWTKCEPGGPPLTAALPSGAPPYLRPPLARPDYTLPQASLAFVTPHLPAPLMPVGAPQCPPPVMQHHPGASRFSAPRQPAMVPRATGGGDSHQSRLFRPTTYRPTVGVTGDSNIRHQDSFHPRSQPGGTERSHPRHHGGAEHAHGGVHSRSGPHESDYRRQHGRGRQQQEKRCHGCNNSGHVRADCPNSSRTDSRRKNERGRNRKNHVGQVHIPSPAENWDDEV